jgi:spermidine synthase
LQQLKYILSYFFDITLEKRQSAFSGEVEVSLSHGQYKLSTQNAIYSYGKKYTSFDTAFKAIDIQQQKVESVLVLGFGLGSVVDLLENHPSIKKIIAVDADEVIIDLAKKYLQSGLKSNVEYYCSDAESFINNTHEQYDLILFDVFIEELTPIQFMQVNFLSNLKKNSAQNGTLLFSKIDDSFRSKIENAQFEKNFTAVFPEAFSIDANGNKVFAWFNK